nr:MAG TPA_asm: hypothetical protein [Caudoviricetes sp.]
MPLLLKAGQNKVRFMVLHSCYIHILYGCMEE